MNKKNLLLQMENILTFIFIIGIFSGCAFFSIKTAYSDFSTINRGELVIGKVKGVTKGSKGKYFIEITYENAGKFLTGTFTCKKTLGDYIGDYFSTKYRIDNKITVLIGKDGTIIPYSSRKNVLIKDLILLFFYLLVLIFFVAVMFNKNIYKVDVKDYNRKKSICSLLSIIAYVFFITAIFIFITFRKNWNFAFFMLALGFMFYFIPSIFLERKTYVRGKGEVSYDEEPIWFLFASIFYIIISLVFLVFSILLIKA